MALIINARLPHKSGLYRLLIEQGQVHTVTPMAAAAASEALDQVLDVEGDWLSLGGVDLQINGALGIAFPELQAPAELESISRYLWQQGIDAFSPTLVTASATDIRRSLGIIQAYRQAQGQYREQATVLGAHLEGPFLNPAKRGAHPQEHLQPLTLGTVQGLIDGYEDAIALVTLAPELAELTVEPVMTWLRSHHITVSLGHSLATAEQAHQAFDQGATMVTHAFNAMPGLHHRQPGLLGAALRDSRVSCGFIADGEHICPTMLDLLLRMGRGALGIKEPMTGLFLVSDALSPLGLPDGTYPWDTREITVTQGTARLADGTLSGTTKPLLDGAINLVSWGLATADEAIDLATAAPRRALGLPQLAPGVSAHLLRWRCQHQRLGWQRLSLQNSMRPAAKT